MKKLNFKTFTEEHWEKGSGRSPVFLVINVKEMYTQTRTK